MRDNHRGLLRVIFPPQRHASFSSAVRGRADGTRRKRTIGRRTSAIRGIAVAADGEPDSLLLAMCGLYAPPPWIKRCRKPGSLDGQTGRFSGPMMSLRSNRFGNPSAGVICNGVICRMHQIVSFVGLDAKVRQTYQPAIRKVRLDQILPSKCNALSFHGRL
jgi:hypothetical protein